MGKCCCSSTRSATAKVWGFFFFCSLKTSLCRPMSSHHCRFRDGLLLEISTLDVKPAHRPTSASEGLLCQLSELQLQCRRHPEKCGCFNFLEASRGSVARKKKPVNTGLKLLHPRRRLIPRSNLRGKKEKVVCSASRVPSGSTLPRFFVAHLFATHRRTVPSSLEFCGCVRNKE